MPDRQLPLTLFGASTTDRLDAALRDIDRLVEAGSPRSRIVVEEAAIRTHIALGRLDRGLVWAERARAKLAMPDGG